MKKVQYLFLIVFIFIKPLHSQIRERLNNNDLKRFEIKGDVKSIFYKEYEPVYKNKKRTKYDLRLYDFLGSNNYKMIFNKNGYTESREYYNIENEELKLLSKWYYQYDAENRIIKETFFTINSDTLTWQYSYPQKGITNIIQYGGSKKTVFYQYIQDGNTEIYTMSTIDSADSQKKIFEYDSGFHIVKEIDFSDKKEPQKSLITEYITGSNLKKFEKHESYINNNVDTTFFNYNQYGDVIETYMKDKDKNVILLTYQYKYDSQYNWIEKKIYNKNGVIISVIRREIKYY